jgi:5'-nucleotidase
VAGHRPHFLLTNDDGVAAEGLHTLRKGLLASGGRVSVVAPDVDRSGVARAISYTTTVRLSQVGGKPEAPLFARTGTPVDCVRLGVLAEVVGAVDAVVAGINHGLNIGEDWWCSGTVGAAIEGALLGPSVNRDLP